MAENRKDERKYDVDREEVAKAARDPEAAKKDGAHLYGEGMTTPDSTKVPYTSEGEPDWRAAQGGSGSQAGTSESETEGNRSHELGRDESER